MLGVKPEREERIFYITYRVFQNYDLFQSSMRLTQEFVDHSSPLQADCSDDMDVIRVVSLREVGSPQKLVSSASKTLKDIML